jgi:hypothetical protein
MLTAILIMALGAVVLGAALGYASIKFKVEGNPLVEKIEAILPQTQCGQCGYPGCKPYAEAIAEGEAEINLCPPGGMEGVRKLADLLGREVKPLDAEEKPKQVAIIDEPPASAAPCASRPARSTPSSAPPSRCTPSSNRFVHRLRTVCQTLSGRMHRMQPIAENRQLEVEVSGDRDQARRLRPPNNAGPTLHFQGRRQAADQQGAFGAGADRPSRRCRRCLIVPLHQNIGGAANPLSRPAIMCSRASVIGSADKLGVGGGSCADLRHRHRRRGARLGASLGSADLECDHRAGRRDEWIPRTPLDTAVCRPERVREILRDSGVVGLGGAAFPSHAKLMPASSVADGGTGHQRRRVRAVHDLRRPADARAGRGHRARHRHFP